MANIIKIKRGLKINLPSASSATLGELRYATDTNELFIDTGNENKLVNKEYIDTKVNKTNSIKKVYATDASGNQTTISYSDTINASYMVQRDSNAQIIVPEVPIADENAASKKYVDGGLALKANSADLATVATTGSYTDLINTPTFKTINSEYITGTGDIPLQTQLSGNDGNVVTYTSTTGTLGELGFDNTPTQNSNKLVKSGPIWTELQKKINYTDIINNLTTVDTNKPLSAYQGKVLDEKITLAQQSTHDRGVTLNALVSQDQNYTITSVTIATAGTNYTVGDTLFLTSDLFIDAILNITSVDSTTGAITGLSVGQGGSFTTDPTSPSSDFIGGTGTGATFNLTTSLINNSTLLSVTNPQPNDFVTVLYDELHDDLRYVWKYADIDGNGTYEWVSGYPITNVERNFHEDPIEGSELGTNAVTITKIANKNITADKLADDSVIARHITDGTITDTHIASGANIQQSKILNLTTDLNNKVSRTASAYQVYGTSAANTETTITYSTNNDASTIAQRDANSQINVALTPTVNTNATSKKYVDDGLNTKVDKVNGNKRVYGTDSNGNQTTYDYDSFGKVDDVKVGTTSVVVNKIASLGTMAGEDKNDYVLGNNSITPGTKCKITYDAKGLVTVGNDLSESDIPSIHLSKISDVNATYTEVNYLSGVTSNVQTQLSSKVSKTSSASKVYGTDANGDQTTYGIDSFGKVDDVKVGTTSVVTNKIANLGTMAGESKTDYVDIASAQYITGTKYFTSDQQDYNINIKDSSVEYSVAPNTDHYRGIQFQDQNNATSGYIRLNHSSGGSNAYEIAARGQDGLYSIMNLGRTAAGISYLNIPQPTDNNTSSNQADTVGARNTALDNKVTKNASITGATKCKITYDSKGLVTAGADLADTDIPSIPLSKISDVTASATELNYVDGVTSNIQTQLDTKATDTNVVHKTGNETINGTKTFNETLELKSNLSFRSYGSSDSGRLQFRAQPSDNVIRGTVAITDGYSTSGSGYNGFVAQMVARAGSTTSEPFNTIRVSNKGIEYIKENNDGTITGQYIVVDDNGLVPSDRLATSGTTGQVLTKTASGQSWETLDALPSQSGQSGKFLTTNGTNASWATIVQSLSGLIDTLISNPNNNQVLTYNSSDNKWVNQTRYAMVIEDFTE